MPINFKTLLKLPPCWLRGTRNDDIILTTAVRLVRNLPGHSFPGWSTAEERAAVAKKILPVLRTYPRLRYCYRAEMSELDHRERCILLERKLITPGMAARQEGCHLLISRDQEIFAMVNEEEHLCVHVATPGFDVEQVMGTAADISRHLEDKLSFARNAQDGYLTSLPNESGEGLQLIAVLHLPALSMSGSMEQVSNALEKMHINITPFTGDAEDCGSLYVLYTQAVPTDAAMVAAEHFSDICKILSVKEQRMIDQKIKYEDGYAVFDIIYRAYGLLRYSYSLSYGELLNALSFIRFGMHRYLLIPQTDGVREFKIPHEILHLYELGPASLRYAHKMIETVHDAQAFRSERAREAIRLLTPLLPL